MKCACAGTCGAMSLTIELFTEPTSDRIAPGFSTGPICAAMAPQAPTGAQTMTRSAPLAASALVSKT